MPRRSTDEMEGHERMIDVRGPRFAAGLTTVVLGTALVAQLVWLVALQAAVFAVSSVAGLRWSPYGALFRLAGRLFDIGPPPEVEPEGPPRFAQTAGLGFTVAALVAFLFGAHVVGWVLVGVVLALAALLAATGICVGCELYVVGQRLRRPRGAT
jgi:hypothetical protein